MSSFRKKSCTPRVEDFKIPYEGVNKNVTDFRGGMPKPEENEGVRRKYLRIGQESAIKNCDILNKGVGYIDIFWKLQLHFKNVASSIEKGNNVFDGAKYKSLV